MKQAYNKVLKKFVMVLHDNERDNYHIYNSDCEYLGRCCKDNLIFDLNGVILV